MAAGPQNANQGNAPKLDMGGYAQPYQPLQASMSPPVPPTDPTPAVMPPQAAPQPWAPPSEGFAGFAKPSAPDMPAPAPEPPPQPWAPPPFRPHAMLPRRPQMFQTPDSLGPFGKSWSPWGAWQGQGQSTFIPMSQRAQYGYADPAPPPVDVAPVQRMVGLGVISPYGRGNG